MHRQSTRARTEDLYRAKIAAGILIEHDAIARPIYVFAQPVTVTVHLAVSHVAVSNFAVSQTMIE